MLHQKASVDRHKIYIYTIIENDKLIGFLIFNNPIVYYHLSARNVTTDPHIFYIT